MRIFLFIFFMYFTRAQYNQRWTWVPKINAQGQPVLDAQGNPTFKAQWRPDNNPGTPLKDVLFTQTSNVLPYGVELEYNCFRMPAICQNVNNWRANPALPGWHVGTAYDSWFTYDIGASDRFAGRGSARRERQCPSDWKTLPNGLPRCPMPGQPQVVPPLWDATGAPVTQIVPQVTGAPVNLKIADGRDQRYVGQVQDSGRKYSCDEFPPASWIEGGHGIPGDQNARQGTPYCVRIASKCVGDFDKRGSEQNWKGYIHGVLGAVLEANVADNTSEEDTPIAFRFTTSTQPGNIPWAARVRFLQNGALFEEDRKPGTHWERRSEDNQSGEILLVPIENGKGSSVIHMPNGEVFRPHEQRSLDPLLHRIKRLARRDAQDSAGTGTSKGGRWENNCLKWRLDPNADLS